MLRFAVVVVLVCHDGSLELCMCIARAMYYKQTLHKDDPRQRYGSEAQIGWLESAVGECSGRGGRRRGGKKQ